MTDDVRATARSLMKLGYHVTPLEYKSKATSLQDWPDIIIVTDEDFDRYFPTDKPCNVGMLMGTEVGDGIFTVAYDIDLEDGLLIERVRRALAPSPEVMPPAKKGAKGMTFFARTTVAAQKKVLKRKLEDGKRITAIDVLGRRTQTVLPPSIHPKTNTPYEWVGRSLLDVPPAALPLADISVIDEINAAVALPDNPMFLLNEMVWLGVGKGGTVDATLLSATAAMVNRGWTDEQIKARCDKAVRFCLYGSGLDNEWSDALYSKRLEGMIEDARRKGFDQAKGKARVPTQAEKRIAVAEQFIEKLGGLDRLWRDGIILRRYEDGYWPEVDQKSLVHDVLHSDRSWIEVIDAEIIVRQILMLSPARVKPNKKRICLGNGTLDLETYSIEDWSWGDMLTSKLPFDWDPDATAPNWEKCIAQVFDQSGQDDSMFTATETREVTQQKSIDTAEEFFGLTLVDDMSFQKMLAIKGDPGSGKSTLVEAALKLHDPRVVASVPVTKLGDERMKTSLVGKLVNLSPEVRAGDTIDDDVFKTIVSGDPVSVRRLYEEVDNDVRLNVRIIMTCNELFRTRDVSGAVERRMILLGGGKRIETPDRDMPRRLAEERPGILVRLVHALRRLYERTRFDPPMTHSKRIAEFSVENNSVALWLRDRTHEGRKLEDENHSMKGLNGHGEQSRLLYADFCEWLKMNGLPMMSSVKWGVRLTDLGYGIRISKVGGISVRCRALHLLEQTMY